MTDIHHKPESTAISSVHWIADTNTLKVTFKNGGTYHYHGVSREKAEAMVASKSAGKHLREYIIPHHVGNKA